MVASTDKLTLTQRLADYVTGLRFSDLSVESVTMARRCILDAIGCGLQGITTEEGALAASAATDYDEGKSVGVWGTRTRASAPTAAFVNGTAAHARELDDWVADIHAGAVIVPAALALGEKLRANGQDLITAVVAGYEVGARVSLGAGPQSMRTRGWMPTGPCGPFAAATVAGKLLDLDTTQMTWALGLAGSYAGGIWAFGADGTMSKRFMCGKAAEAGIVAAFLARRGFTGPAAILESPLGGFFPVYMPGSSEPDSVLRDLGREPAILMTGFKPYASCLGVHGPIEAALEVRRAGVRPEDVTHILVTTSAQTKRQGANRKIRTLTDAQLSVVYGVAVSLVAGDASIAAFTQEWISNPDVIELLDRIALEADDSLPNGQAILEVRTRDGSTHRVGARIPRGYPQNPMSEVELVAKFRTLAAFSLPDAAVAKASGLLNSLETLETLDDLVACLTP
jgi:2-methylcitrate dehydratase PrpD